MGLYNTARDAPMPTWDAIKLVVDAFHDAADDLPSCVQVASDVWDALRWEAEGGSLDTVRKSEDGTPNLDWGGVPIIPVSSIPPGGMYAMPYLAEEP